MGRFALGRATDNVPNNVLDIWESSQPTGSDGALSGRRNWGGRRNPRGRSPRWRWHFQIQNTHGDGVRAGKLSSPMFDAKNLPGAMIMRTPIYRYVVSLTVALTTMILLWSYWPTFVELAEEWWNNPLYSYAYAV